MASVVVTMSGDEAKLWRAFQKIVDQQRKVEEGYKKTATKSRQASGEMESGQRRAKASFDSTGRAIRDQNGLIGKATESIASYATAAGAVGVAIGTIRAAWQQVIKEQEKGLAALKSVEGSERRLVQIADSKEQFQEFRATSQSLASQFGVDVSTVQRVMFSAVSEGFRDAVPDLIAANQVIAPESAAAVAGKLPTLFEGQVSPLEAVSLTLKAAERSNLDFEKLASTIASVAEGGSLAGASVEESLALQSVLSSRFASGETSADRIKGFATKLGIDERFKGLGVVEGVEALQTLPKADREKFLGESQELNVAFNVLSQELGTIKTRVSELRQERQAFAAGGGILRTKTSITLEDEQLSALRRNAQAKQQLDQAYREGRGIEGASAETASMIAERQLLQRGSLAERTLDSTAGYVLPGGSVSGSVARASVTLGADEQTAANIGTGTTRGVVDLLGMLAVPGFNSGRDAAAIVQKQSEAVQRQEEASKNLLKASETMLKASEKQAQRQPEDRTGAARAAAAAAAQGS